MLLLSVAKSDFACITLKGVVLCLKIDMYLGIKRPLLFSPLDIYFVTALLEYALGIYSDPIMDNHWFHFLEASMDSTLWL